MIFYEQPSDPWTPYDFLLLEAYQMLQDETCNICGNPVWVCHSDSSNVAFKMRNSVCFADREQKRWEKAQDNKIKSMKVKGKDHWEPDPGEQWFPVPYTVDGGPFPTRNDYLQAMADRME